MSIRRVSLVLLLAIDTLMPALLASAQDKTLTASVCEVAKDPATFDNKLVRLRATLAGNFEISAIRDPDDSACDSLWFTYPGSGAAARFSMGERVPTQPRPAVRLKDNLVTADAWLANALAAHLPVKWLGSVTTDH